MSSAESKLLTVLEVAERLGVSRQTVWRFAVRGEIPSFRIGKQLRFDREEVEAYLKRTRTSGPAKR